MSERERVDCDKNCGAFEYPHTLEEYKIALEHCEGHSVLSGCSHGC